MAAILELFGLAHRGNHGRGGDRPNAADRGDLLAQGRALHERFDPGLGALDALLQGLNLLHQLHQHGLADAGHFAFALAQNLWHSALERLWRLRNRHPSLAQQASCLVDQRRALCNQQLAHAMKGGPGRARCLCRRCRIG